MNEEKKKKFANNILEFLFDPTVIPVEQRLYFRPEEILKNQSYEAAKAEADRTYGDQRHNSDFYPKMSNEREATSMDRKTLIASMDILSQNFQEEDPIAKDLRTMAYAISQMSDEELELRLATDVEAKNPWMDHMKKFREENKEKIKGKTLKEVIEMAKKTYKKAEEEAVAEEKEITVDLDNWSKEASEAVKRALIADVVGEDKEAAECKPAEEEEKKEAGKIKGPGKPDGTGPLSGTPECQMTKKEEKKKKEGEEKEAGKIKGPGIPDGTGPRSGTPACPMTKEEEEKKKAEKAEGTEETEKAEETEETEEKKAEEEKVEEAKEATEPSLVNTEILGIQMEAGMILPEDIGDLSPEEEAKLGQLFQ